MLLRGDINRIFDEKLRRKNKAKAPKEPKEPFFDRPQRPRREKNAKWFDVGLGIDLPFCLIILILLTIGTIMMFSASYAFAFYTQDDSYYYLKRQIIFILVGLAGMVVLSVFN